MLKTLRFPLVLFICLTPLFLSAQTDSSKLTLQDIVNNGINEYVPGLVVVLKTPDTLWTGVAGKANLATGEAMTAGLRFRIASITKQFTAVVMLKLQEEGKLNLEDPVEKFFPGLVPYSKEMTIRHLLSHRSGLYNVTDDSAHVATFWKNNNTKSFTPEELIKIAISHPPNFKPGEPGKAEYCNTGYVVAGMIIQKVTGKPLAKVFAEKIFKPLGMKDSYLAMNEKIEGSYAHGYTSGQADAEDRTIFNSSKAFSGGGIVSTAADLVKWSDALLGEKIISRKSLDEMMAPLIELGPGHTYGLGIHLEQSPYGKLLHHSGEIPGYNCFIYHLADKKSVLIIFQNAYNDNTPANGRRLKKDILNKAAASGMLK